MSYSPLSGSPVMMEGCYFPIESLPLSVYQGEIIVVENPHQIARAENLLRGEKLLGFDMEWKPEFKPGQQHPIALIQISTRSCCVIFRMLKLGFMPKLLRRILTSLTICKVGHSVDKFDAAKLWSCYRLECQNIVDLKAIAKETNRFRRLGLQALTAEVLKQYLDKTLSCSNWAKNHLTDEQILYAATDAWVTREVYIQLTVELKCKICCQVFKCKEDLLQHQSVKEHNENSEDVLNSSLEENPECQVCGKFFWSERARTQHQRDKDHFYFYSPDENSDFLLGDESCRIDCQMCGKLFTNDKSLFQHQQAKGHISCQICAKSFLHISHLFQHQQDKNHYVEGSTDEEGNFFPAFDPEVLEPEMIEEFNDSEESLYEI